MRTRLTVTFMAATLASVWLPAKDRGTWLERANADPKTTLRRNPFDAQPEAVAAGEKLYRRYCASCHGRSGEGGDRSPGVNSARVRNAPPGALYWLLRNGSLGRGMPSWSHLPPEQRWQLVSWLQSFR